MRISMLKKLVLLDLTLGIKKRYLYFEAAVIIFAVLIGYFVSQCNAMLKAGGITSRAGLGDCLLFVFNGIEEYKIESGLSFRIPSLWLLVNILFMFIVGYYPVESLKKSSLQFMLRSNTRIGVWISKIIWCFFAVGILYLLLLSVSLIAVMLVGDINVLFHSDICENVLGIDLANINALGFSAPFLIILMTAAIQVNLSIILSPVLSNLTMIIYMVGSVYYSGSLLVYNYCMYKRIFANSAAYANGLVTALVFSLILFIISSFSALKKSSKIDICR